MTKSSEIKTAIKNLMVELQKTEENPTGILGEIIEDDFKINNPLDRDISSFPAVIINPPSVEGIAYDNARNLRTYTFNLGVVLRGEDISSASEVEELMEALMDKLDNHPTLNSVCDGGVEPSISSPEPTTARGKTFVIFVITIKAKGIMTLT